MTCKDCIHSGLCYKENDYDNFPDRCGEFISDKVLEERPKGEWKVRGIGINTQKNIWHVVCPKCNCDMFTEFTSYCPNCGEPKKEINIAELNMRGDKE